MQVQTTDDLILNDNSNTTPAGINYSLMDMSDCLRLFYLRYYPFDRIYRWLSYGSDAIKGPYFTRREFSMTLLNQTYLRFQSFLGETDMRERITSMTPIKIDIGAVYSARPSEKKSLLPSSFTPLERELVFDIDMTDYDDVRKCCQDKAMCNKCWQYIVAAVKILDATLRTDFGFKNILWVFSGRRGIHCWVADKRARILDSGLRKAILSYIEFSHHTEMSNKKFSTLSAQGSTELHPMIKRALSLVTPIFKKKIIPELFSDDSLDDKMLSLLLTSLSSTPEAMKETWKRHSILNPVERWKSIISLVSNLTDRKQKYAIEEFILYHLYPRLDSNVSIGLNHLLKAPFCVHPDTGKLCIPVDPSRIHEFNPENVPTVQMLLSSDSGCTLLQPYLSLLDQFLTSLELSN